MEARGCFWAQQAPLLSPGRPEAEAMSGRAGRSWNRGFVNRSVAERPRAMGAAKGWGAPGTSGQGKRG